MNQVYVDNFSLSESSNITERSNGGTKQQHVFKKPMYLDWSLRDQSEDREEKCGEEPVKG